MTNEPSSSWFPFELREEHAFEDEPVLSCYLGKVFHFWQGRNAYWGRWSSTYPGDESFSLDLADVKTNIEVRRVKGSQWTIAGLPVVVISGEKHSLLLGEINTTDPLSEVRLRRRKPLSLGDYGVHFEPRKRNSIFRIVCLTKLVSPATLPFYRYQSISYGGSYSLSWTPSVSEQNLERVLRTICRINKCLQREGQRAAGL